MLQPDSKRTRIFEACRPATKHNLELTMFLLPYLVEAVLLIGHEEEYQEILNEISVVLAHVDSTGEGADANEANVHPVAQTIFRVVDTLSEWTIGAADSATAVTRLLEAIPRYTLARASYRCDAHARALMYLEMHLAGRKAEATRGELSFLQAWPRPAPPVPPQRDRLCLNPRRSRAPSIQHSPPRSFLLPHGSHLSSGPIQSSLRFGTSAVQSVRSTAAHLQCARRGRRPDGRRGAAAQDDARGASHRPRGIGRPTGALAALCARLCYGTD